MRLVYATTLADLITLCRNRPAGERLKAAGSHWALSAAAISDHTFVETQDPRGRYPAMDRTLHEVAAPDLLSRMADGAFPTRYGTLVHVEAGKRIFQLYAELDQVDPVGDKTTLGGHMRDRFG
jgi:hypothetical protein